MSTKVTERERTLTKIRRNILAATTITDLKRESIELLKEVRRLDKVIIRLKAKVGENG